MPQGGSQGGHTSGGGQAQGGSHGHSGAGTGAHHHDSGGGSGSSPQGPTERLRFRVIAGFARATSEEITVSGGAAGSLANPRWSTPDVLHAEHAELSVDAPGLDGHMVRFRVEVNHGGAWHPYATARKPVHDGVATARVRLHHPAALPQQGQEPDPEALSREPAAEFRFHAELV